MKYVTDAAREHAKKNINDESGPKREYLDNPKLAYEKYINAVDEYNANAKIINEYLKKLFEFEDIEYDVGMGPGLDETLQMRVSWDIVYNNGAIEYLQKESFDEFVEEQKCANIPGYYSSKYLKK